MDAHNFGPQASDLRVHSLGNEAKNSNWADEPRSERGRSVYASGELPHLWTALQDPFEVRLVHSRNSTLGDPYSSPGRSYEGGDKGNYTPDGLTITAPVPLPYAARSKAVLQSMLSSVHVHRQEDVDFTVQDVRATRALDTAYTQGVSTRRIDNWSVHHETAFSGLSLDFSGQHERYPLAERTAGSIYAQIVPVETDCPPCIIRPISPSTLIALTEPCLMAWCLDEELNFSYTSTSEATPFIQTMPWPSVDRLQNSEPVISSAVNSWGY